VIIPFAGGSASDVVSCIMFDKMSKSMGQPIVIENRLAPAATPAP
jgi:tripartite-type tricarboxylate transporter receptor subunit TctC